MKTIKSEKGQILVILALALVAMLAVTALAVDGSMIYNERRKDQSAADSVALAAAQEGAKSTTCTVARTAAISKAISYASAQAGITLANDAVSPSRVEATCSGDGTTLDIRIVVTSNTPTTFAQMVSRDQLTTTVETVSRVTFGAGTFAGGNGIVTLGSSCGTNGGIHVAARGYIKVKGGGAYSASCINVSNSPAGLITDGAPIYYAGKGAIQFYAGSQVEYTGTNGIMFSNNTKSFILSYPPFTAPDTTYTYQLSNGMIVPPGGWYANPAITQSMWPIPITTTMTEPTIPDMVAQTCSGTDYGAVTVNYSATPVHLYPGIYTSINHSGWAEVVYEPGTYCIRNGGFVSMSSRSAYADNTYWYFMGSGSFSKTSTETLYLSGSSVFLKTGNFTVSNGANMIAENTTIYIEQGNFTLSGNVPAVLTAPDCISTNCTASHAIPGVAIYIKDRDNTGTTTMTIDGSSSLDLEGTIFAPKTKITVIGDSGLETLKCQIISRRFEITGSSEVNLDLTDANTYSGDGSTTIELRK